MAKKERTSHQLLIHGLPGGPAGPQEEVLNNLMEALGKKTLGEDGFNVVQDNIIGAHQLDPPPGEKTPQQELLWIPDTQSQASVGLLKNQAGGETVPTRSFFAISP